MPPKKAPQPTAGERQRLAAWVRGVLAAEARARAGDPGRVVVRRLSNAEYENTVRDLTGLDLRPAHDFPADGAAGEGFTNVGDALVTSPTTLARYLAAAKETAAHAVPLPEGFRFSPAKTARDWTDRGGRRAEGVLRPVRPRRPAAGPAVPRGGRRVSGRPSGRPAFARRRRRGGEGEPEVLHRSLAGAGRPRAVVPARPRPRGLARGDAGGRSRAGRRGRRLAEARSGGPSRSAATAAATWRPSSRASQPRWPGPPAAWRPARRRGSTTSAASSPSSSATRTSSRRTRSSA